MTEAGKERMREGGLEGAYLGPDGRVHIPGKRVTLYSKPSPPLDEVRVQGNATLHIQVHVPQRFCLLRG